MTIALTVLFVALFIYALVMLAFGGMGIWRRK
jgi:hypothetical protein